MIIKVYIVTRCIQQQQCKDDPFVRSVKGFKSLHCTYFVFNNSSVKICLLGVSKDLEVYIVIRCIQQQQRWKICWPGVSDLALSWKSWLLITDFPEMNRSRISTYS